MARYHLNPDTGNPLICHAIKRCPYGDLHTDHFETREEALKHYEEIMGSSFADNRRSSGEKRTQAALAKNNFKDFAPEELKDEWDDPLDPASVTVAHKGLVGWKCKTCGHKWRATPRNRTSGKKTGCPECAKERISATKKANSLEKQGFLSDRFPKISATWDSEKNGDATPETVSAESYETYYWRCDKAVHSWPATVRSRTIDGYGCSICAGKRLERGFNDFISLRPDLLEEIRYDQLSPNIEIDTLLVGSSQVLIWSCSNCSHEWPATVRSRAIQNSGCPECAKRNTSGFEKAVLDEIRALGLEPLHRTRPLISSSGRRMEIDILLPDLGLGFEIQDAATHSKTSDSEPSTYRLSQGTSKFKKGPAYHELKRQLALEQLDVKIIDIWEDEIKDGRFRKIILDAVRARSSH